MVIAVNRQAEWKPVALPYQVWISTIVLLVSSVTFEFARRALNKGNQKAAKNWLLGTTALGGIFVASQLLSWQQLVNNGVYVEGNPYAGFFYIMTATHAIHLIGGIGALGYLVLRTWKPTRLAESLFKRQTAGNVVSLYWHTMDGLWLVLLGLLVFWK
jgi:cytochrome c oxidase subunit 3